MNISSFLKALKADGSSSVPACICGVDALKDDLREYRIKLGEYIRTKEVIEHCYGEYYAKHASSIISGNKLNAWELEQLIPIETKFDDFVKQIIETFNMQYIGYTDDRFTDADGNTIKDGYVFKLFDVNDCKSGYIIIQKEKPYYCTGDFMFSLHITYVFDTLEYTNILSATNHTGSIKVEKSIGDTVYHTHKDCDEFQKAQFCYLSDKISEMFDEFIDRMKDRFYIGYGYKNE